MGITTEEREAAISFMEWLSDDDIRDYILLEGERERKLFLQRKLHQFSDEGDESEDAFDAADAASQHEEGLLDD